MVSKTGKYIIGILGGSMLGSGLENAIGLGFLGAPIGAILLTAILLELHTEDWKLMKDYWLTTLTGFLIGGLSIGFGAPSGSTFIGAGIGFISGYLYFEKY
jgi:hypothetical protein